MGKIQKGVVVGLMFNRVKKEYKKRYKFYQKELSNFKIIMKDTNDNLIVANQYNYNCMSYALGVFDKWLSIKAFDHSLSRDNEINYKYLDNVFHNCCLELEERFAVRRISGPTAKLEANERVIAFRIGADDFHFVRRNSDGTWTHKPGKDYIREMNEDELFSEEWSEGSRHYPYISEIAFFAVKM